jgi:subtilisin family serine protease
MKKIIYSFINTMLFVIIISLQNIYGYSFTDYYYYEGKPYHLLKVPNQIFLELNANIDQSEFENLISQYTEIVLKQNFDFTDKKDFVFVLESLTNEEYQILINDLNERTEIKNASPVFRMPDGIGNFKTLIGIESQIIVQFKPQIQAVEIGSYLTQRGMTIIQEFDLSGGSSYLLSIPKGGYAMDYANELFESGLVNYSEPNLFFTNLLNDVVVDPNDPLFPQQWSHRNNGNNIPGGISGTPGCDMSTDSAWTFTMGDPNVIVSIVDTGIDTLHEDLADRIIHGISINTYSNLPYAWDDNNHGTCTSGIVAASGNNNLGIIGVAPLSRIFGVKIFNAAGNTSSSAIINGLIAAWQRGSWVSSNSWGGGSPIAAANNAISDGVNLGRNGKGVVWCFASGNENNAAINWPSTNPNVIAVGGISPCNQRKNPSSCDLENWWGSNYGNGLSIVAPTVKIFATDRTGSVGYSGGNYFSQFNGTSSATPNVSGVCALILAVDSSITWDVVRERICSTADKVGTYVYDQPGPLALGGWNNEMGYGRINAYEVVKFTVQSIPVELSSFNADARSGGIYLSWSTATETNNQGFEIQRKKQAGEYKTVGFISGSGTTTELRYYSFYDTKVGLGNFNYRLKQIDFDGSFSYSNEIPVENTSSFIFFLEQNFPNPFNPETKINFTLAEDSKVTLKVYDVLGQEVVSLLNANLAKGIHEINFIASGMNSGVYFYKLQATGKNEVNFIDIKKMILTK